MTAPCPVCLALESQSLGQTGDRLFHTTLNTFELRQCRSCQVVFLVPVPTAEQLAAYYPGGYWWGTTPTQGFFQQVWNVVLERYRRVMVRRPARAILSMVRKSDSIKPRLLDLGCGDGLFLASYSSASMETFGLDTAWWALRTAREQRRLNVLQGSIETLPLATHSVHIITMFHILEHVADPHACLREINRVLAPGGWLLIQVPNSRSWQCRLLGLRWIGFDVPRHLVNYSDRVLRPLLESHGFRVDSVSHFSLRDNPAMIVMSLAPRLYPPARRLRSTSSSLSNGVLDVLYLLLVLLCTPFAWMESALARGGTILISARKSVSVSGGGR